MLSQSYIHPFRMRLPSRAEAGTQCVLGLHPVRRIHLPPALSVAKECRFQTERLLASPLSYFESGLEYDWPGVGVGSNLQESRSGVSPPTSELNVPFFVSTVSFLGGG